MPRRPTGVRAPARPRPVLAVVAVLVLVLVAVLVWRGDRADSRLESAIALAPAEAERLSWTDWAGVRRELGSSVAAGSSPDDVAALVDDAFTADLSPMSALGSSAAAMHEHFAISPANLEWELFAQSGERAVSVLEVVEGTDLEALGDTLESLGWTRPEDDDGVWVGGPEVLASVGQRLTPQLQHWVIRSDDGVVLTSDEATSLESLDDGALDAYGDVAGQVDDALAASLSTGAYACQHLAMAQADDTARAEADALLDAAGEVHPLTGYAIARRAGDAVRVVMQVEDADDARTDAETRSRLASGPAPGQGGDFTDRFEVTAAAAEGRLVLLDLAGREGAYVLSDLSSGPVLFATC